jgi:hypothetical protein
MIESKRPVTEFERELLPTELMVRDSSKPKPATAKVKAKKASAK